MTDAIRVELAHAGPPPIVHIHQPAALVVTDRNCEASAGLSVRSFRKIGRAMIDAGLPATRTADGFTVLRADLERFFREHAPPITTERETAPPSPSDDDLLRAAGCRPRARASHLRN